MNEKTQRAVEIYNRLCEALHTDTRVTKGSLARALGCSTRTVRRDLEALGSYFPGVEVGYDESLKTFFLTQAGKARDDFRLKDIKIRMQNYDLFLLLMGTHILAQYQDSPTHQRLQESLKRLAAQLPKNPAVISHQKLAQSLTALPHPIRAINPDHFDLIKHGIEFKVELEIIYCTPNGKKSTRKIHPYYLDNNGGDFYVIAWCLLRKEIRLFALSRIEGVKKTKRDFVVKDQAKIVDYLESRFGVFMGEPDKLYQVKLRFSKEQAPYVSERVWHAKQKILLKTSGELELSFPAPHLFEVTRWVLSWGSGVKVLKPAELARQVKQELKAALARY